MTAVVQWEQSQAAVAGPSGRPGNWIIRAAGQLAIRAAGIGPPEAGYRTAGDRSGQVSDYVAGHPPGRPAAGATRRRGTRPEGRLST